MVEVPALITGPELSCKSWRVEAILRMLYNNLANAEEPEKLIIYGGTGQAARSWDDFHRIVKALQALGDDETLLIQSGRPVGVFRTHPRSPRVLFANSHIVPQHSDWSHFNDLYARGLTMYGQMTAGSWSYIGTQGIIQGTYETFAALADQHFGGSLSGKLVVTGGLGGMGGAQPMAIKMNEGVALCIEVDSARMHKRLEVGYLDEEFTDLEAALARASQATEAGEAVSIGILGNCADVLPALISKGVVPDVLTDQTSAHDPLNGYVPNGMTLAAAIALRTSDPDEYLQRARAAIVEHVKAMVRLQEMGAITFDYGNNIRGEAAAGGFEDAFAFQGFVPLYVRPLFCEGRGPFRWIAVSGDPADIVRTDALVKEMFQDNAGLMRWIDLAAKMIPVEGLPARVCWLGYGERARFGLAINDLVAKGELRGPIVITRDHLDCGSVASPNRETEGMLDGSDWIADWPILNALLNCAAGADTVSLHNGGGVGIGMSTHAGMHVIADGSELAREKISAVLTTDPGTGIMRHADAGYPKAIAMAKEHQLDLPSVD